MTETQHPKMVLLGAGSLFFGRQAIWQMVHSPHLNTGTLALVDTNEKRLQAMATLAAKVIAHEGVPLALEASTERKDVLPGADLVLCVVPSQFSVLPPTRSSTGVWTARYRPNTACACALATRSGRAASFAPCASCPPSWTAPGTSRRSVPTPG